MQPFCEPRIETEFTLTLETQDGGIEATLEGVASTLPEPLIALGTAVADLAGVALQGTWPEPRMAPEPSEAGFDVEASARADGG